MAESTKTICNPKLAPAASRLSGRWVCTYYTCLCIRPAPRTPTMSHNLRYRTSSYRGKVFPAFVCERHTVARAGWHKISSAPPRDWPLVPLWLLTRHFDRWPIVESEEVAPGEIVRSSTLFRAGSFHFLHLFRLFDARRESFVPNCNILSVLSILKCNPGKMTSLLSLRNFDLAIPYHRHELKRKRKRRIICIRFGHSLWSANQLPV